MLRFDSGSIAQYQVTGDGFLRAYMRIAKADHPLVYRNVNGSTRTEICSAKELFNQDSLDSFLMLPVTHEHPPGKVTSANYLDYGRGSTGQSLIKEVTPVGTFLGTISTIFDESLVQSIVNGDTPGVSPGYHTRTRVRQDGVFEQFERRGNHIAAVRNPRGGEDVKTVLAGLRVDSVNGLINEDLWVQDVDSAIYRADVGDWISPLLGIERQMGSTLLERQTINLDQAFTDQRNFSAGQSNSSDEECDCDELPDKECDCEEKKGKRKISKISRGSKNRKDSSMTDQSDRTVIDIGGVPLELSIAQAAIIQPALNRMDSAITESEEIATQATQLRLDNEELSKENAELRQLIQDFIDLEDQPDEKEKDDELSFDSVEKLVEFVDEFLNFQTDAKIVGLEFADRKSAIASCLLEPESVQRQILGAANPGLNMDSHDAHQLSAVYSFAMAPLRQRALNGGNERQDAVSYVAPLRAVGSMLSPQSAQAATSGMAAYEAACDAAFIGAKQN